MAGEALSAARTLPKLAAIAKAASAQLCAMRNRAGRLGLCMLVLKIGSLTPRRLSPGCLAGGAYCITNHYNVFPRGPDGWQSNQRGLTAMQKVTPCLWFDGQAEPAARFYVSLLPDSRIERV